MYRANVMAENVAILMLILYTRQVHQVEENPSGTHLFDYDSQAFLREILGFDFIHTWMICFGHAMPKPSRLLGSLVNLSSLTRKYSKQLWERRSKRLRRKLKQHNLSFRRPTAIKWYKKAQDKQSVVVTPKASGLGSWTNGGRDLKASAAYTRRFADALLSCWESNRFSLPQPCFSLQELLHACPFPMHGKQFRKSAGPIGPECVSQEQEEICVDPTSRPSACTCWFLSSPDRCNACKRLPVSESMAVSTSPDGVPYTSSVPEGTLAPGGDVTSMVPVFDGVEAPNAACNVTSTSPVSYPSSLTHGRLWADEFDSASFM